MENENTSDKAAVDQTDLTENAVTDAATDVGEAAGDEGTEGDDDDEEE